MKLKPAGRHTESSIFRMLVTRYAPGHAVLRQVANGTGARHQYRYADALAISLWPSRGLEINGFEIKVSRYDWRKEIKNPAKSEDVQRYCDRWWIVCPENVIQPGELPPTWGHLEARANQLRCIVDAPKLESKALDRNMFCAIIRRVHEATVPRDEVDEKVAAAVKDTLVMERRLADDRRTQVDKVVAEFKKQSGIDLCGTWIWNLGNITEAIALLQDNGVSGALKTLDYGLRQIDEGRKVLATAIEGMKKVRGADGDDNET